MDTVTDDRMVVAPELATHWIEHDDRHQGGGVGRFTDDEVLVSHAREAGRTVLEVDERGLIEAPADGVVTLAQGMRLEARLQEVELALTALMDSLNHTGVVAQQITRTACELEERRYRAGSD